LTSDERVQGGMAPLERYFLDLSKETRKTSAMILTEGMVRLATSKARGEDSPSKSPEGNSRPPTSGATPG